VDAGQPGGRGECLVVDVECGSHASIFTETYACIKKSLVGLRLRLRTLAGGSAGLCHPFTPEQTESLTDGEGGVGYGSMGGVRRE